MTKKGLTMAKSSAFIVIAATLLISQQAVADIVIRNSNEIENNNTNTATATATGGNATATGGNVNFNNGGGTCSDCGGSVSGSNGTTTVTGGDATATGGNASATAASSTKSNIDSDSKITVDKDGKKSSHSSRRSVKRLPATGSETSSLFALAGLALALTAIFAKKSFKQAK